MATPGGQRGKERGPSAYEVETEDEGRSTRLKLEAEAEAGLDRMEEDVRAEQQTLPDPAAAAAAAASTVPASADTRTLAPPQHDEMSRRGGIFISYIAEESHDVFKLVSSVLQARGLDVFDPTSSFNPSIPEMESWVSESDLMIVVLSPKYFHSKYCCAEAAAAMRAGVPIIPVYDGDAWHLRPSGGEVLGWRDVDTAHSTPALRKYVYSVNLVRVVDTQDQANAVANLFGAISRWYPALQLVGHPPATSNEAEARDAGGPVVSTEASGRGILQRLLQLPTGIPPVAASRNKLLLTGEGRSGKTSLRQALKGAPFNPLEASTRGVTAEDLQVIREDLVGWSEVVSRTPEEVRAIAHLVWKILRNEADLSELSGLGLSKSALDKLLKSQHRRRNTSGNMNVAGAVVGDTARRRNAARTTTRPGGDGGQSATTTMDPGHDSVPTNSDKRELDSLIAELCTEFMKNDDFQQKLILSLWDFGGQKVFLSLHTMFLTPEGVYTVVFNPQELLLPKDVRLVGLPQRDTTDRTKTECLWYLREWLNSIYVFAPGAPVYIVGTCLDLMDDPEKDIPTVCDLIEREVLKHTPCAHQIVEDDENERCCFFVSSFKDADHPTEDPSVTRLRLYLGATAVGQEHVHERVPANWLRVLDRSVAASAGGPRRARMSRDEFRAQAEEVGIGSLEDISVDAELDVLLAKFHDLGLVLWYDVPQLRDLVVLDPQWVIDATSAVIRDPALHDLTLKPKVLRTHADALALLYERAILEEGLLQVLWPSEVYTHTERDQLVALLCRFGLLVPLHHNPERTLWLVPSLLEFTAGSPPPSPIPIAASKCSVCYIFFQTTTPTTDRGVSMSEAELRRGFLPSGLFHRLLGSAVHHMQQALSATRFKPASLCTDWGELYLDTTTRYVLERMEEVNCIKLSAPVDRAAEVLSLVETLLDRTLHQYSAAVSERLHRRTLLASATAGVLYDFNQLQKAEPTEIFTDADGKTAADIIHTWLQRPAHREHVMFAQNSDVAVADQAGDRFEAKDPAPPVLSQQGPLVVVASCPHTMSLTGTGPFKPVDNVNVFDVFKHCMALHRDERIMWMAFDRPGTSTVSTHDRDVIWSLDDSRLKGKADKAKREAIRASVEKSMWFHGFKTSIKQTIKLAAHSEPGRKIRLICIEGGPITELEQEYMSKIVQDSRSDAKIFGFTDLRITIDLCTYRQFREEFPVHMHANPATESAMNETDGVDDVQVDRRDSVARAAVQPQRDSERKRKAEGIAVSDATPDAQVVPDTVLPAAQRIRLAATDNAAGDKAPVTAEAETRLTSPQPGTGESTGMAVDGGAAPLALGDKPPFYFSTEADAMEVDPIVDFAS